MKQTTKNPARGVELLTEALGQSLQGITRNLFGTAQQSDPTGDGITTLCFDHVTLSIKLSRNEDFLIVEKGPIDSKGLNPDYWTKEDLSTNEQFSNFINQKLCYINCYTDGFEDVALVFNFNNSEQLCIILDDTDLLLKRNCDLLQKSVYGVTPQLRTCLGHL